MYKNLSKAFVLTLFLGKSKAITDHSNGLGGEAPCLQSYMGVWGSEQLGFDAHAVHGVQAADGGYVAVGNSLESEDAEHLDAFVVKTKGSCFPDKTYAVLDGSGCNTYDWITRYGAAGKTQQALSVAESPDGTYLIVAGFTEESDGLSKINIAKL